MKYTPAFGDKLCRLTAKSSVGLRTICARLNVPYSTVTGWVYDPQHELHGKYMQAKQIQLHVLAEEIVELIDDHSNDYVEVIHNGKKKIILNREHIARTRLRVKARMDIITKLAPILYSTRPEKIKHTVTMLPPAGASASAPEPALDKTSPVSQQDPQPTHTTTLRNENLASPSPSERTGKRSSPKNTSKALPRKHPAKKIRIRNVAKSQTDTGAWQRDAELSDLMFPSGSF